MKIDNDITKWLIWDYIASIKASGVTGIQNKSLKNIQFISRKYDQYAYYIEPFDKIYNYFASKFIIKSHEKKTCVLFHSTKYTDIINGVKNRHFIKLLAYGPKDRLYCIKSFFVYASILKAYKFLNMYLSENDAKYLDCLFEYIKKKIEIVRPDFVVLINDSLPIERCIILVCRELGITTLVIQHGIYSLKPMPFDGRAADYVLVWGQHFKDLYIDRSIRNADEVYVLGYPYMIEKNINFNKSNKHTLYYLGNDFEEYFTTYLDVNILDVKFDTLNRINEICSKLDIKFCYRPHPGSNRKMLQKSLPHINFTSKKETLTQTFMEGDIFISFNSSTLTEAGIRSKLCIQLMNYPQPCDNYEELGVCSKSVETLDDLEEYLTIITKYKDLSIEHQFNNDYVDITKNPSESFLEILKDIEKIKQFSG